VLLCIKLSIIYRRRALSIFLTHIECLGLCVPVVLLPYCAALLIRCPCYGIQELHDTRFLLFRRNNFSWRHIGARGIGCSSTLLIIFISPIMVVQKSTKQNKIKYLSNLTRKKIELTTSIHYNISINSSINGGQTDQFFRYRPTFCECLKQYIV